MVNIQLLQAKIDDSGIPMTTLARKTGISVATLYNRLAERHGEFTVSQITALTTALHLTLSERDEIFFSEG